MLIKFPQTLSVNHLSIPNNVELYWIRHLHSCANMLESIGGRDIKLIRALQTTHIENITERTRLAPNPHVSPFGISHALGSTLHLKNLTDLIQPDLICASQLIRTWETAYLLFLQYFQKQNPLYVLPYIGEQRFPKIIGLKRLNLDNQPDSIPVSKKKFMRFFQYLQKYISLYEKKRFDQQHIQLPLIPPKIQYINRKGDFTNQSNKSTLSSNPNFSKFMKDILPHLISLVHKTDQKPIRIVLVTHSHFMEHNILPSNITIPKYLAPRVDSKGILRVWNADCYQMTSKGVEFAFPARISFDQYMIPKEIGGGKYHVSNKNTLLTFIDNLKDRDQNKHHEEIEYALGMCAIEEPKYIAYVLKQWNKIHERENK